MINKKVTIIIGAILLAVGASLIVNAAGIIIFRNLDQNLNNGLVLNLNLGETNYTSGTKTFADASGAGNNGVAYIASTFGADNYERNNGAMSFAANNYVNVSSLYNTNFPQTAGTIAIWVYGDFSAQSNKSIIDDYDDTRKHIFFRTNTTYGLQAVLQDPVGGYIFQTYPVLENNKWNFIVLSYNTVTDNVKFYHNGVQTASATMTNTAWVPDGQRVVFGGTGNRFTGLISDVKIYNRDLTASEVQALYKPRVAASSLQSGLVGYWPLDEENYNATTGRVNDKTPYENHCTNNGATLIADRTGKSNGAMDFNGTTNSINCGNGNSLKVTGNQTYAFWIYPRTFATRRNPIDKAYGGEGTVTMETNGAMTYYWGTGGGNTTPYSSQQSAIGVPLNQWTHVVHVRNLTSNQMIWYFNGVPNATSTPSYGAAVASNNNLTIGEGYVDPINGSMADVRVYNRALSASEINTLYNSNKPKVVADSLQKNLILDMPLNSEWTKSETAGSQVMTDKTPYSRDGQNYGSTLTASSTSFDGNDYITLPYGAGINPTTQTQTFSMWVKANVLTDAMFFSPHYDTVARMYLGIQGGDWEMGIYNSAWGAGITDATTNWTHILVTMDGSYAKMYINGIFDHQKTYASYSFLQNFNVGRNPANNYYFNGQMSNLKIYNRALSATEAKSLYDKGR